MKNTTNFLRIIAFTAIIGFLMAACSDGSDSNDAVGKLTINGLNDYNGKYVFAYGESDSARADLLAVASASFTPHNYSYTAAKVIDGSATLEVWGLGWDIEKPFGFNKSGEVGFDVYIISSPNIDNNTDWENGVGFVNVNFSNGDAIGTFSEYLN